MSGEALGWSASQKVSRLMLVILKRIIFAARLIPNLSTKAISSLGTEFCKLSSGKLNVESLQKKALTKKSVGAMTVGQAQKKDDRSNDDKTNKKTRKE
jgi:hypothetical protein